MARGKGKRGGGRGSGKRFAAQSAEEIEERNRRLALFDEQRAKRRAEADEENDKGGGDADADAEREAMLVGMRVARMNMGGNKDDDDDDEYYVKERKPKGLEGIIESENLNKMRGSGMLKIKDLGGGAVPPEQMTRKQREEVEKAAKVAAYRKRHEMGLTEEYKRDMAKLNEVRKRRELAESRINEQKDLEKSLEEERKKEALEVSAYDDEKKKSSSSKKKKDEGDDIPKLDKITIKKMKPSQLKDALKDRGLQIQGNSKQLTERLLTYEKDR